MILRSEFTLAAIPYLDFYRVRNQQNYLCAFALKIGGMNIDI